MTFTCRRRFKLHRLFLAWGFVAYCLASVALPNFNVETLLETSLKTSSTVQPLSQATLPAVFTVNHLGRLNTDANHRVDFPLNCLLLPRFEFSIKMVGRVLYLSSQPFLFSAELALLPRSRSPPWNV